MDIGWIFQALQKGEGGRVRERVREGERVREWEGVSTLVALSLHLGDTRFLELRGNQGSSSIQLPGPRAPSKNEKRGWALDRT